MLKMLKVPIIVDPKPRNISYYSDVFMVTPNKKEFEEIFCGKEYADYTLVTLGKDGMELYDRTGHREEIKSTPVDVFNVSGAGDVVVATVSVALSQGYSVLESAKIANECAAYSVTKPGTCRINKNKYIEQISQLK